ncbi:MAG: hypothetical protein AAGI91_06670 [Bacteroidota bacterium]
MVSCSFQVLARRSRVLLAALLGLALLPGLALAQRPFDVLDPFYQEESARRAFYDGFALSGEIGYRSSGPFQRSSDADPRGPLALSFQLDYALASQLDVSAVFDASGGLVSQLGGGPVRLSWIVLKPYWHNEGTDYAVRIAVDPASEGGLGFRQTDIAFVSTSNLSPTVTSSFAIGLRHAQVGYERLQVPNPLEIGLEVPEPELVRTRAIGQEIHLMWGHHVHFDPAGSNVFLTLLAEAMDYDLVESRPFEDAGAELAAEDEEEEATGRYRGGVGWLRAGVEFNRPGYQFSPFIGVPVAAWTDIEGETNTWGPRFQSLRFGLRLTLR